MTDEYKENESIIRSNQKVIYILSSHSITNLLSASRVHQYGLWGY